MKILLVNHTLDLYAGSETFTYSLAVELQRQGHEAVCFSPRLGLLADRLQATGIFVTDELTKIDNDIDVIHGHHRYESFLACARFPDKPMIMVCHGIFPWQEQPLKSQLNVFRYVAVSEEVNKHLVEKLVIDPSQIVVIRNGIDLTRFRAHKPIDAVPRRALVLSNNMPNEQKVLVRRACEKLGIGLAFLGGMGQSVWNVEDHINDADIVFSLGRGALESMACVRAVIVHGYSGADGMVTPDNFRRIRESNFSGRASKLHYGENDLVQQIEKYQPSNPERLMQYVVKEHDIKIVARRYLDLYQSAIDHRVGSSATAISRFPFAALQEVVVDAETYKTELLAAQVQIEAQKQELTRFQAFSDAVRQSLVYRFYKTFIKPILDKINQL